MKPREEIIGVREVRARLSAHLRAVAAGKTVTIGDRRRRVRTTRYSSQRHST